MSNSPVASQDALRVVGYIDSLGSTIRGWIFNAACPNEKLTVRCLVDNKWEMTAVACEFRGDVQAAGYDDGRFGFTIQIPSFLLDGCEYCLEISVESYPEFTFSGCQKQIILGLEDVEIHSATAADIDAFAQFWDTHLHSYGISTIKPLQEAENIINKACRQDNSVLCVACASGQILGFCALEGKGEQGYRHVAILRIAILSVYRGKGLGKKLLRVILAHARRIGLRRIELTVNVGNKHAIQLYESFNFQREGVLRDAHFGGGSYSDELLMSFILDEVSHDG